MIKYIIIAVLIFSIGFVIGAGYGYLRREKENNTNITNLDKFKQVYGFEPYIDYLDVSEIRYVCLAPQNICTTQAYLHFNEDDDSIGCDDCPFNDWWHKQYSPYFKFRINGGNNELD